jgi:EAL domain-containing protein (putative c-di-GMP-specific phosphodiesterase class I)
MKMTIERATEARARRAKILFVDDEATVTTAMRRVLSREPFEVMTANTIDEAQALLREHEFDVIVSDESMPEMSGSKFLAQVRKERPFIVRMLLTGQASLDTAIQAVNHGGIFRFLQKPCSSKELITSLHEAIEHQRDRVLHPPSLAPPPDPGLAELQARYDRAVEGLWVALQPVVSPARRSVYAYECLVRTREPTVPHGGAFCELAEQLAQSKSLDRTIRARVASMLTEAPELIVLVNLHPSSLDDDDLFSASAPLSAFASRVVLEITERASLTDMKAVRDKVTALRALGYRIAVDDLGAGYAGLQSLVLLQPEVVKIDMELVRNIDTTPTKAKLVSAVITLCRELGADVIAEGIETLAEFRALEGMGCPFLQGYYFARPGPAYPAVKWPE